MCEYKKLKTFAYFLFGVISGAMLAVCCATFGQSAEELEKTEELVVKAELIEVKDELHRYKRKYDGLILFEDGSWMFKDGVYYEFWNEKEPELGRDYLGEGIMPLGTEEAGAFY